MVKCTGRGLVVKWPGVLSKVQLLNLALGVGGLFPSSNVSLTFVTLCLKHEYSRESEERTLPPRQAGICV